MSAELPVVSSYDIITVGGGLGGAALAKVMAEKGARVLVLERTREFKDRIRGEVLAPWGQAAAQRLGLRDILLPFSNEMRHWHSFLNGVQIMQRDVCATTPTGYAMLCYFHPDMQNKMLEAAAAAGAEVRRGVAVRAVECGTTPKVTIDQDGKPVDLAARLVVGVDGRESSVRKWCGFETRRDRPRRFFAGLLVEGVTAPADTMVLRSDSSTGTVTWVFPQRNERARLYVGYHHPGAYQRLQGEGDVPRFLETHLTLGLPKKQIERARAIGPLATFDATENWVDHPYRDGVALIGDAAATSDPTWGQGMSLTLRDVCNLTDALVRNMNWDVAGHEYAEAHDRTYRAVHDTDGWLTDLLFEPGPEAEARRARALPLIAKDPTRIPDTAVSGPECPTDEAARRRLFGED
jgi:2-polyprenyl-6-methoxyphenol hydroxylase-like FAD-dependent oxidoreductase